MRINFLTVRSILLPLAFNAFFAISSNAKTSNDLQNFICRTVNKSGQKFGNSFGISAANTAQATSIMATLHGVQTSRNVEGFQKLPAETDEISCNDAKDANSVSSSKGMSSFDCVITKQNMGEKEKVKVRSSSIEQAIENLEAFGGAFILGHPRHMSIECVGQNKKVISKDLKRFYCQGGYKETYDTDVFETYARDESAALIAMSGPAALNAFQNEEGNRRYQIYCSSEYPKRESGAGNPARTNPAAR